MAFKVFPLSPRHFFMGKHFLLTKTHCALRAWVINLRNYSTQDVEWGIKKAEIRLVLLNAYKNGLCVEDVLNYASWIERRTFDKRNWSLLLTSLQWLAAFFKTWTSNLSIHYLHIAKSAFNFFSLSLKRVQNEWPDKWKFQVHLD